jgi:hypothetical protein
MKPLAAVLMVIVVFNGTAQPPKKQPPKKDPPGTKPKAEAKPKPKIKDPLVIKITTTTGQGNKYAGSGGNKVYILINGDEGQKHRLTNREKPFQRGATDKFELKLDFDPSKIESLRLLNESSDMWKCETITFQFFKSGKESRVIRHSPGQYLSSATERKALHAKPFLDFKMRVVLEEPKKNAKGETTTDG